MARKSNKRSNGRRKVNPMLRRVAGPPRPRLSFDGSNVSAVLYDNQKATAANNSATFYTVDCSSTTGCNRTVTAITGLYSEYRYNSLSVDWVPGQGPANTEAASRIYFAYLEGPERMATYAAAADAVRTIIVKGIRNVKSCNVWERFTYNVPLTWRRKVFDVNTTAGVSADELERSTQGMLVVAFDSVSAVTTAGLLGQLKITSSTRVNNLSLQGPT